MAYVNFNRTKTLEEALEGQKDTIYFTSDTNDIIIDGTAYGGDDLELSEESVPYSSFNKDEYSLTLGYDSDGKLEILVIKDLEYALTLSVTPSTIWYGSRGDLTATVSANDYTKGAVPYTLTVGSNTPVNGGSISPNGNSTVGYTYLVVTSNITTSLVVNGATTTKVTTCNIPILYSKTPFVSNTNYTIFDSNNIIGTKTVTGTYSYNQITPDVNVLYIAIPDTSKTSIKYIAEVSSNESPLNETLTLKINGQPVDYSVFTCNVIKGSTFKITG